MNKINIRAAFESVGVPVARKPSEIPELIKKLLSK